TGVATTKLSKEVTTPDGNTVALTAGDIDEAVSGLLTNGLVAGDVNGESVPAGFNRIDAFRIGVLGDQDRCIKRFP
ncbi:MAG: peptidase, partial [Mycolicibacterium aromaticivorans]|nr:peptidase [Mycolicibacterium aromaticivorans]